MTRRSYTIVMRAGKEVLNICLSAQGRGWVKIRRNDDDGLLEVTYSNLDTAKATMQAIQQRLSNLGLEIHTEKRDDRAVMTGYKFMAEIREDRE